MSLLNATNHTSASVNHDLLISDPTSTSPSERLEFINMHDEDQSNYVFVVDDVTNNVYQVPINNNGVYTQRKDVSKAVQFIDASGNPGTLPGMYDADGNLVPFNDYYVAQDGYLYGNVAEKGADPNSIHDGVNSTWVKLGPANQYSDLPSGVSFAVIVNSANQNSIGVKQDHASEPPQDLSQSTGAVFDSSIGNIPLQLGDVDVTDAETDAVFSYTLPLDINNGMEPMPFDEYHFRDVGGDLRLYVIDNGFIYDMGLVPENFYGNNTAFEDGDIFIGPNSDGAGSGESGERVNKKFAGDIAYVLDATHTVANTGKGNDVVHITELGFDEEGEPLTYYVDMGKGAKDELYFYGSSDDWTEVETETVNANGFSYNRKFVHDDTGTVVYINASTNRIDYFTDNNYEKFDFSKLKGEGSIKYSGDISYILDASHIAVDTEGGNDSVYVTEVGWDENGEPLKYYAQLGNGNGDTLYLYGEEGDWKRVVVERFKAHGNKFDRMYVHEDTGTVVYYTAKADKVAYFTD